MIQLSEEQEAIKILEESIDRNCFDANVISNFLKLLTKFGQGKIVSETYEKIITNTSQSMEFLYDYARLLEKSNEMVKFEKLILQNDDFFSSNEDFKFLVCLLNYRKKKYNEALETLQIIDKTNLYFTKLSAFYSTFGKVLEKVGNYEFAFQNFKNMNMEKLSTVNDLF